MYEAFLSRVPILSTLTREEVLTIADCLVPETVSAGTAVVRQGDAAADRFYIVEEGELKAEIEGIEGEVCDRMGPGSYFGERALIKDMPRAATVTAVTDTKLLAMDRAAFLRLLGPITDLLARNMELYEAYTAAALARSPRCEPGSGGGGSSLGAGAGAAAEGGATSDSGSAEGGASSSS
jgi:cAMP-dependent protein kinase regulator